MSVKVKNYTWHRDWHQKMMSDPGYTRLSAEERGVYQTIRNLAGISNNNGSVRIGGSGPLNSHHLAATLADLIPGMDLERAKAILRKLILSGVLSRSRKGRVTVTDWREEQQCAPSYDAERQRRTRERRQVLSNPDSLGRVGAAPAAPAPSTSTEGSSTGSDSSVTCRRTERDMSHIEDKDEDRREEDTSRRLEVRFDLTGAGAAGAAGNPDADLTIWETPDPLRRALEMTGEFSKIMKNTLAKRLGEVGEQRFRGALAELQDALRTGKARNPGRLLIHILTEIKNGVHRP